jgi:DNA-binding transcriptional LysR family regulator
MSFEDVRRLRTFGLVIDLGSISGAAAVLGYTQSAVSQQLAALERELDTTLVDRSRRPLQPTPAGAALRPDVDRVLAAVAGAQATLADVRAGATRRLRLAAFPSSLSSFVAPAVRDLRRSQPDLVVQVLQHETRASLELLAKGGADLAVVHHMTDLPEAPTPAGLHRRLLLHDHLQVVLPQRHRLAAREEIHLLDLEHEPLLAPRRDTPAGRFRALLEQLCAQAGFTPRVAYEVDDLPAAQAFAAAGIAIVVMHRLTLHAPRPGIVVRPLAGSPGTRTVEAVLPSAHHAPAAEALLGHLTTAARAL